MRRCLECTHHGHSRAEGKERTRPYSQAAPHLRKPEERETATKEVKLGGARQLCVRVHAGEREERTARTAVRIYGRFITFPALPSSSSSSPLAVAPAAQDLKMNFGTSRAERPALQYHGESSFCVLLYTQLLPCLREPCIPLIISIISRGNCDRWGGYEKEERGYY